MGPRRRTLRSARRVKSGPRPAGHGGRRPGAAGKRERRKGRVARGRAAWRAARSCRRGRPAGPGAGSRTVTAARSRSGGAAGRAGRAGLPPGTAGIHPQLCPPGQVRTAQRGDGLDTRPRATGRYGPVPAPHEQGDGPGDGPAMGRAPRRGHGGARRVRHAPPSRQRSVPTGSPMRACLPAGSALRCQKDLSWAGWPRVPPLCPLLQKSGFQGLFSRAAGKSLSARRERFVCSVACLPLTRSRQVPSLLAPGDPCRIGPRVRRRQGNPSQSGRPVQYRQVPVQDAHRIHHRCQLSGRQVDRPVKEPTVEEDVDLLVVERDQPGDRQQLAGREVVGPGEVGVARARRAATDQ